MSHRPMLLSMVLIVAPLIIFSCRSFTPSSGTAESDTGSRPPRTSESPGTATVRTVTLQHQQSPEWPASLVRWDDDRPTLQVLFATNRIPQRSSPGSRWSYDRQFDQTLRFGISHVTIPEQRRGKGPEADDPPRRLLGLIPLPQEPPPSPPPAPTVTLVQPLAQVDFHQRLQQMLAQAATPELLLFVHGFNMNLDASTIRAAQVAVDMPFDGAVVCFSWPSRGSDTARSVDTQIIEQSSLPLARLLADLLDDLPRSTRVHVVAHCMGNRALLEAINKLPSRFDKEPRIDNLVLAAPDVSTSEFRALAPRAPRVADRVTMYVCDRDPALAQATTADDDPLVGKAHPPVVVAGIETIETGCVSTSLLGREHTGHELGLLGDLAALIRDGRPASQRPWLEPAESSAGMWWVCQQTPEEPVWSWPRVTKRPDDAPRTSRRKDSTIQLLSAPEDPEK